MVDFKTLKKSSDSIAKISAAIDKINNPENSYSTEDTRFWQPTVDKAGNGYAVIRFLPGPAVDGEDALPWVRVFSHGFQGVNGWYIENSLTTLGQKDPVSELNSKLWNSGVEADKDVARKQKRKLAYISNILVITDSAAPENEGKVKLYRYGKKIFDKVTDAMNPPFPDRPAINPFDFWKGANFKLKIRQVEGYRNYDLSEFDASEVLFGGDDDKLEKLWQSEYSLKAFVAPDKFKSYAVLKAKLYNVLGKPLTPLEDVNVPSEKEEIIKAHTEILKEISAPSVDVSDEDDSYFQSLLEDNA